MVLFVTDGKVMVLMTGQEGTEGTGMFLFIFIGFIGSQKEQGQEETEGTYILARHAYMIIQKLIRYKHGRILVWEDGFCNFGASASPAHDQMNSSNGECPGGPSSVYGDQFQHHQYYHGLQPELFFKMSHEIYNYGEG